MPPETHSWQEWSQHVLVELQRLSKAVDDHSKECAACRESQERSRGTLREERRAMADKLREEFDRGLEKTDAEVGKMRESVAKLDAKVAGIVAGISIIVSIIVNVIIYLLKKG